MRSPSTTTREKSPRSNKDPAQSKEKEDLKTTHTKWPSDSPSRNFILQIYSHTVSILCIQQHAAEHIMGGKKESMKYSPQKIWYTYQLSIRRMKDHLENWKKNVVRWLIEVYSVLVYVSCLECKHACECTKPSRWMHKKLYHGCSWTKQLGDV